MADDGCRDRPLAAPLVFLPMMMVSAVVEFVEGDGQFGNNGSFADGCCVVLVRIMGSSAGCTTVPTI